MSCVSKSHFLRFRVILAPNLYIPETKLRLAIQLWSDMRNFVSFFLFAITVVFSNLLLSKITINLHLFTYTRLKIYTPYSAFSSIFHFRSLYPNPINSKINLQNATGNEYYILMDCLGKPIWQGENIDKQDFSFLPNGFYLLNINNSIIKLIKD